MHQDTAQLKRRQLGQAWYLRECLVAAVVTFVVAGLALPAHAIERNLAGVRILSPAIAVLHLFGNPDDVLVGAQVLSGPASGNNAGPGRGPGMGMPGMGGIGSLPPMSGPGMGAMMGAGRNVGMMGGPPMRGSNFGPEGAPGGAGMPDGMQNGPGGFPGKGGMMSPGGFGGPPGMGAMSGMPGMSGFPGGGFPGAGGMFGMRGMPGAGQYGTTGDNSIQQEVTYVYQKSIVPAAPIYEFLLSPNGLVIQITVLGYSGGPHTSRGIALGSSYNQVIAKYGYPEAQTTSGAVITVDYTTKAHAAFQIYNNKVIGMMVAAVQPGA